MGGTQSQLGPLPTGGAYLAAASMPRILEQMQPEYIAQVQRQVLQAQQAQMQAALLQQQQQPTPGWGMGLPVWHSSHEHAHGHATPHAPPPAAMPRAHAI